jgi:hypothetical protein
VDCAGFVRGTHHRALLPPPRDSDIDHVAGRGLLDRPLGRVQSLLDVGLVHDSVASIHAVRLVACDALTRESHPLKRVLKDPCLFSGIGNAYADEILHRPRLSAVKLTRQLEEEETARLLAATRETRQNWIAKLRRETGEGFPEKVTAFRPGMAVHGRFGQPCPVCGSPVQRIVHAENETNYCAQCQTGCGCWPTARCPACSPPTGLARCRNWRSAGRGRPSSRCPRRCFPNLTQGSVRFKDISWVPTCGREGSDLASRGWLTPWSYHVPEVTTR